MENVLNLGQWITFALDELVEFAKVVDGSYCSILFGNCHHWHAPFTLTDSFKDVRVTLSLDFVLEYRHIDGWNGVWSLTVVWLSVLLELDVKLAFGILAEHSIEEFRVLFKNV